MQIWRALTRPSYRYLKISSGFYFLKKSNYKKKALRESHLNERCIGMAGEGEGNSVIVLQRRTPFGEEKRFRTRPNSFTKLSQYYIWFSFRDGCWISILFRSRHLFVLFFSTRFVSYAFRSLFFVFKLFHVLLQANIIYYHGKSSFVTD